MFAPLCGLILVAAVATATEINLGIVGGSNANIGNHPWQASLRNTGTHSCGATLVAGRKAVTAAHCGGGALSAYSILAGTSDRTVDVCFSCALRSLTDFVRHPNFANNPAMGYPNDIAVLTFANIATNAQIQHLPLANDTLDGDFSGESCVISGWGRVTPTGQFSTTLQQAAMDVITNAACIEVWNANRVRPEQICASDPVTTLCGGDNGGPLVCGGDDPRFAGVFSFNEASCSPLYPAVFSRVSAYNEWIMGQLQL